jgi:hypothetical protein
MLYFRCEKISKCNTVDKLQIRSLVTLYILQYVGQGFNKLG